MMTWGIVSGDDTMKCEVCGDIAILMHSGNNEKVYECGHCHSTMEYAYGQWEVNENKLPREFEGECPLCKEALHYRKINKTDIYECTECTFVGLDLYGEENIDDLEEIL